MREAMRAAAAAVLFVLLVARSAPAQPRTDADMPRITLEEFKKDLAAGLIVAVDVRSPETYRAGHIPGAIQASGEALKRKAADFKGSDKTVVTYCA